MASNSMEPSRHLAWRWEAQSCSPTSHSTTGRCNGSDRHPRPISARKREPFLLLTSLLLSQRSVFPSSVFPRSVFSLDVRLSAWPPRHRQHRFMQRATRASNLWQDIEAFRQPLPALIPACNNHRDLEDPHAPWTALGNTAPTFSRSQAGPLRSQAQSREPNIIAFPIPSAWHSQRYATYRFVMCGFLTFGAPPVER